jgi:hypothetical protein
MLCFVMRSVKVVRGGSILNCADRFAFEARH